jgi:1-deoxyxylulose-5-phosphate synthase
MEYQKLGRTDLLVSRLCLGTMQFGWSADEPLSHRILSAAWEAGVNFLDTADIYSRWVPGNPGGVSEAIIGRWLTQGGPPREKMVIATKVRGRTGNGPRDEGLSKEHILKAAEASLRRLGTDYIDLYQTHWPDEGVPIEETLRAFDDLVRAGKVRYIGCSNYSAAQLTEALDLSTGQDLPRFESLQPHYNLIHREDFERDLRRVCRQRGLGVIPYSPLAGGFLTGKYRQGQPLPESVRAGRLKHAFTERNGAILDALDAAARACEASLSQAALAWLLADPLITSPIIGPNTLEQLDDNLAAVRVALPEEARRALDQASTWQSDARAEG